MCGHRGEDRLNQSWQSSSLVFDTAVSDKCDHKTLSMALVLSRHVSGVSSSWKLCSAEKPARLSAFLVLLPQGKLDFCSGQTEVAARAGR